MIYRLKDAQKRQKIVSGLGQEQLVIGSDRLFNGNSYSLEMKWRTC